ncbi:MULTISPECIES: hypothetical protein [Thiorhodovibrio]|uniref:hypothetical protein n=1 Tax=Thiorhodovibrio TaxID=61593 RepID=UPI0019147E4A|nr:MULTISPECIES: hypothetical protein [Thiorhodovibrio]MBK5969735.1 hypothetical protein [Thiorhodovibrio winogradskyi]WPL13785.1 hypothetical protein Thiosp_03602 [Thiorhodovibrio litoralis]
MTPNRPSVQEPRQRPTAAKPESLAIFPAPNNRIKPSHSERALSFATEVGAPTVLDRQFATTDRSRRRLYQVRRQRYQQARRIDPVEIHSYAKFEMIGFFAFVVWLFYYQITSSRKASRDAEEKKSDTESSASTPGE